MHLQYYRCALPLLNMRYTRHIEKYRHNKSSQSFLMSINLTFHPLLYISTTFSVCNHEHHRII